MVLTKGKPNFTEGPLFTRLFLFTLPIIATSLLQIAYNMADNIVVGQFAENGTVALSAVGLVGSYNTLYVNTLIGLGAGSSVVVAQLFGANRRREMSEAIHTASLLSVILGIGLMLIAFAASYFVIGFVVPDAETHPLSMLYFYIVAAGYPALSVYNFGASILRSLGDSKTPLFILAGSGILNVGLNVLFVCAFHMSVAGVALATIISQYASAVLVTVLLIKHRDPDARLSLRKLKIYPQHLRRILYNGIPTAISSSIFSVANILISSTIGALNASSFVLGADGTPLLNDAGEPYKYVAASNTIASNIDGVTYQCMNGFNAGVMTFAGQNFGAMKRDRMKKVFIYGLIQVTLVGIVVGAIELLCYQPIANMFIDATAPHEVRSMILEHVFSVMLSVLIPYSLCGIMGVMSGYLRGIGYSTSTMIGTVACTLIVRLLWIYVFFPHDATSLMPWLGGMAEWYTTYKVAWLYVCYPVTWTATIIVYIFITVVAAKAMKRISTAASLSQTEKALGDEACEGDDKSDEHHIDSPSDTSSQDVSDAVAK